MSAARASGVMGLMEALPRRAPLRRALLLRGAVVAAIVGAPLVGEPARAQQPPDAAVSAGVRPARVRVGDTFVVTVRVVGPLAPEAVELALGSGAELVDVQERSSRAVGGARAGAVTETDFSLLAVAAGAVGPLRALAVVQGDTLWAPVPPVVAVAAPLAHPEPATRRAREGDGPVRDEGLPPPGSGRTGLPPWPWGAAPYGGYGAATPLPYGTNALPYGANALPYGTYSVPPGAYGGAATPWAAPGYPGAPFPVEPGAGWGGRPWAGSSGWGAAPVGRPWASEADGDPAWPDLVPRLERYQAEARDDAGLVTLGAGLTPERVYAGQQVTLVATASFAPEAVARLGPGTELFPPSAGDAWTVEIPYAPPTPAASGGRLAEAHTVMRAFFANSPGTLSLDGVRLAYAVGSGGAGHAPREEVATGPLAVEILPIPQADAPPGWSGAVGRYRVGAWVEPSAVGFGEAAFLTVEVAGAGNVRTLARPDPGPVWGAELRPVGERAWVEVRDGVVGGAKTFTWLVVPVEPELVRIGPVLLPFFDPWMEAFGQVASEEVVLDARPGLAASPYGREDLRADAGGVGPRPPGASGAGPEGWDAPDTEATGATPEAGPASSWIEPPGEPDPHPARLPALAVADRDGRVRAALDSVAARPADASRWLALASALEGARPGEGWREWALLNGLRRAPRDPGLRAALWGGEGWEGRAWALSALPLTAREKLAGAAALALAAAAAAVLARLRRSGRRALVGTALALAAGAATLLGVWVLDAGAGAGVAVEGPVLLRAAPSWSSPDLGSLASGAPVRVIDTFGDWVRVTVPGGVSGWTEGVQVLPVDGSAAR